MGAGRFYGDVNGDCVFDIKDVRRASELLLLKPEGSTAVPTEYLGTALCDWQQEQLDPTLDTTFKQNDAVYLLNALAKKYRFVSGASLNATSRRWYSLSAATCWSSSITSSTSAPSTILVVVTRDTCSVL